MNYAVVDKCSNRAMAIIENSLKLWFEKNFPLFDIIEIGNTESSSFVTNEGTINTISIFPIGKNFSKDAYHIITRFPDTIDLEKAYELIK